MKIEFLDLERKRCKPWRLLRGPLCIWWKTCSFLVSNKKTIVIRNLLIMFDMEFAAMAQCYPHWPFTHALSPIRGSLLGRGEKMLHFKFHVKPTT
jgi:hypothetical protein